MHKQKQDCWRFFWMWRGYFWCFFCLPVLNSATFFDCLSSKRKLTCLGRNSPSMDILLKFASSGFFPIWFASGSQNCMVWSVRLSCGSIFYNDMFIFRLFVFCAQDSVVDSSFVLLCKFRLLASVGLHSLRGCFHRKVVFSNLCVV